MPERSRLAAGVRCAVLLWARREWGSASRTWIYGDPGGGAPVLMSAGGAPVPWGLQKV